MSHDVLDDLTPKPSSNKFMLFRKSKHSNGIYEIADILKENGIKFKIVDNSVSKEMSFADTLHNEVELKLLQSDFKKANALIKQNVEVNIDEFDRNYYLFSFSNDELYEILFKPDEWGDIDYKLSQHILKERGIEVNEELISSLNSQRMKELNTPQDANIAMIIMGFVFAFIGGLIGILIGWYLMSAKKTLPNGDRIYIYKLRDRTKGRIIFILGMIVFPISYYLRLISVR